MSKNPAERRSDRVLAVKRWRLDAMQEIVLQISAEISFPLENMKVRCR